MISLTPASAELIGIHTGDGTLYDTNWKTLVWESRGHLDEKEYYTQSVTPMINKLFDIKLTSKWRSGGHHGVWGIQTTNKLVTQFMLDAGFKPGPKSQIITVPDYIWDSSLKIQRAFIRGYFDTDGCMDFDKKNGNILHTYPKLLFGSVSKLFIEQFNELLRSHKYRTYTWYDRYNGSYRIGISGKEYTHKWFKTITPHNTKHLKKYLFWKEYGFCEPFLDLNNL